MKTVPDPRSSESKGRQISKGSGDNRMNEGNQKTAEDTENSFLDLSNQYLSMNFMSGTVLGLIVNKNITLKVYCLVEQMVNKVSRWTANYNL